jgi:cbb3-type cytochrome oxidase subunit 3
MKLFDMLVLVVAIVAIAWMFRPRRREAAPHANEASAQAENMRLKEEMKALKERVAVLERIATDRGTLLDQEIERLRDR